MKALSCQNCGSTDLYDEKGYRICRYCGTKHVIAKGDQPAKYSTIELNKDVKMLLEKCQTDPERTVKYAERILEIDPNNEEAKRIIAERSKTTGGCYVATAIYGSYDCPQVWTLRRYRDYVLAETWYGRVFVHVYYCVSPFLVKWFGKTAWFKIVLKQELDRKVRQLNSEGVEDSPYSDRVW